MERQFLIVSLFFLIGLSSCQSNQTIASDIGVKCSSGRVCAPMMNMAFVKWFNQAKAL